MSTNRYYHFYLFHLTGYVLELCIIRYLVSPFRTDLNSADTDSSEYRIKNCDTVWYRTEVIRYHTVSYRTKAI